MAFAFDMQCGEFLIQFETEREQRQIEAMSIGSITTTFGGVSGGMIDRGSAVTLDA